MTPEYTNALIHETSPYLLQHAHNPVNWEAWGPEVLKKAVASDRPLLISIGYAACHWCHVMEHECFEDVEVAKVMNDNFINIKIDREERPDVDHIYMDALQMMTGSGGWPLNIVAMPDGRPFWGATYVKKENWIQVLRQISDLYGKDRIKVTEYAQNLADGIRAINLVEHRTDTEIFSLEHLDQVVKEWLPYFDADLGGYKRAPKFMMPVNLNFLLHYAVVQQNKEVLAYVNTTLTKMAWGGIFDHVGGGFSRYSVDMKWHVPHFEKMLYDNGQLISLYAQAYAATQNELYKAVTERTISFVVRELMDKNHGFYSSLDADSLTDSGLLEEGAYYVWKENELRSLLGDNFKIFKDYFNINDYGHWEHDNYVLVRNASKKEVAENHDIEIAKLDGIIDRCLQLLEKERNKRNRPRLDDKILTSWNGLMLKGLIDAYRYLENSEYLDLALKNAGFIHNHLVQKDGGLYHNHKNGKSTINGYLEDYAAVIDAFIALYEVSADKTWLDRSKTMVDYCIEHFFDAKTGLFFFTSKKDDALIRRTMETSDNVVPASNSIMGKNLFRLSRFFPMSDYESMASKMLQSINPTFEKHFQNHANWLALVLYHEKPFYEIAIVGEDYKQKSQEILKHYLPNTILAATEKESELSILENRSVAQSTPIYVCRQGSCQLPVNQPEEALGQLQ